jgi:hypothetical protein
MMRLHAFLVALLVGVVAFLGSGVGCSFLTGTSSDPGRDVEHVVAEVDSLDVPARIASSDTLRVRMSGTVGPNGCYSFDEFDGERTEGRLTITPRVEHVTGDEVMCTMAIVPLDETYMAAPPFEEGELSVTVPQPDRPDVTATVEVQ